MWRGSRRGCRQRGAGILEREIGIRQGQGYWTVAWILDSDMYVDRGRYIDKI